MRRGLLAALLTLVAGVAAAADLTLDIELDPASRRLQARAELVPPARQFVFPLHDSLTVTAASAGGRLLPVDDDGRSGGFRRWRITLPAPAMPLHLEYGGTLPALDPRLDHRGVLRGLPPMASPAGSFLPAGGGWYPQPAALFSYRVSLALPAGQRALVAGRLLAEDVAADGRYRASFEFVQPADGIDLMAGPWVVRERLVARTDGGPLRLRTYFFHELDATPGLADAYLDDTRRYIERYSAQIGAYPFGEFSVVASPLPTGFGMPTLTFIGADVLRLPFIRATSLGHEILHNWWGNGVYVDYATGNWSEGLTTFMADYAYKEDESAAAAREMRLGWLRDFAAVAAAAPQSLADFRSRTHGAAAAVGYGKAAMLFVMLRDTIGAAAFERGVRRFWATQRFRAAGWDDLRAAFEAASGQPLGAFFAQWLERRDAPQLRIATAGVRSEAGRHRLTLRLEQPAPPYRLRLPVEAVGGERAETHWIDVAGERDTVTLDLAFRPDGVRLDPELRVWRRPDADQLPPILRQWIVAGSPRLAVAGSAADLGAAAAALAARLFESPPQKVATAAIRQGDEPILLVGRHADVDAALAAAGLPPRPANLAGRGTAQVWTLTAAGGPPLAVVSADDAAALTALQRPLPHYGAQSWLVFDGSRNRERGVWPAPGRLLPVTPEG